LWRFGDAGKVLRNEKIKTTDEFLVKKKEPLVLPPDYEKFQNQDQFRKKKKKKKKKNFKNTKKRKIKKKKKFFSIEKSIFKKFKSEKKKFFKK
jgi:hypothetical protein